jgi:rhodanese-related sulfurtransferase
MRRTVGDLIAEEGSTYERVTPAEAAHHAAADPPCSSIHARRTRRRSRASCRAPVHYPLSVVLWWPDPDFPSENPKKPLDTKVILLCRHGYSSSLAARSLGPSLHASHGCNR